MCRSSMISTSRVTMTYASRAAISTTAPPIPTAPARARRRRAAAGALPDAASGAPDVSLAVSPGARPGPVSGRTDLDRGVEVGQLHGHRALRERERRPVQQRALLPDP